MFRGSFFNAGILRSRDIIKEVTQNRIYAYQMLRNTYTHNFKYRNTIIVIMIFLLNCENH